MTLAGWFLGIDSVYFQMIELSGYRALVDKLLFFAVVVAILGGTLAAWAFYNYIRFRGADYRKSRKRVSDQELCTVFKVEKEALRVSKNSSLITVRFNDNGEIEALLPEPLDSLTGNVRESPGEKEPEINA